MRSEKRAFLKRSLNLCPFRHKLRIVRVLDSGLGGDDAFSEHIHDAVVHSLHTLRGLDDRVDLVGLLLADHRPDRAVHGHDLECRHELPVH